MNMAKKIIIFLIIATGMDITQASGYSEKLKTYFAKKQSKGIYYPGQNKSENKKTTDEEQYATTLPGARWEENSVHDDLVKKLNEKLDNMSIYLTNTESFLSNAKGNQPKLDQMKQKIQAILEKEKNNIKQIIKQTKEEKNYKKINDIFSATLDLAISVLSCDEYVESLSQFRKKNIKIKAISIENRDYSEAPELKNSIHKIVDQLLEVYRSLCEKRLYEPKLTQEQEEMINKFEAEENLDDENNILGNDNDGSKIL